MEVFRLIKKLTVKWLSMGSALNLMKIPNADFLERTNSEILLPG